MFRLECTQAVGLALILVAGSCAEKQVGPPAQGRSRYREQVLADRPAGYWRLDESAGTVAFDQTDHRNRGTIAPGVRRKYPGAIETDTDSAMFFDGRSGKIIVPSNSTLAVNTGALTLEAWVKFIGDQAGPVAIVGKGTAGVQTEYALILLNGVPAYQSVTERYLSSAGAITAGAWTHLAVTIVNNSDGTFYVNGVPAGTFVSNGGHAITSANHPVAIGNEVGSVGHFVGGIDEAAIYSYALTAEQVAAHMRLAKVKNP